MFYKKIVSPPRRVGGLQPGGLEVNCQEGWKLTVRRVGGLKQDWEFVHRFSEQMNDSLKKQAIRSHRSFLVSDLSDFAHIPYFW